MKTLFAILAVIEMVLVACSGADKPTQQAELLQVDTITPTSTQTP
jgi:hypothetical protein